MKFIPKLSVFFERLWFLLQGPYCPDLLKYLKQYGSDYKTVCFFTYLYYPSVFGLPEVLPGTKVILIPTAHEEAPLYFSFVGKLFQKAELIFANSPAEKDLIEKVFHRPSQVVGLGFDLSTPPPDLGRLPELPVTFILYLGRISRGKNVHMLCEWMRKVRFSQPVSLVLVGELEEDMRAQVNSHGVLVLARLGELEKTSLMARALCVVNASLKESLSMVVLEAVCVGTPVLVYEQSEVLKEYSRNLSGVFSFQDEAQFRDEINFLLSENWQQEKTRAMVQSQIWVQQNYSWDRVLEKFTEAVG